MVFFPPNNKKYTGTIRDKTIDDTLMYIPNKDKQNYPFCKLQYVWILKLMNQPIKSPKVLGQRIRKCYLKYLGTSVKSAQCPIPT